MSLFSDPRAYVRSKSFELEPHNNTELNAQDQAIEHWYTSMGGAIDAAKNYVASSIKKLITGFVPFFEGIDTAIVSLVSSVINFITNILLGLSCEMNNWLKALLVTSLIASFTTFIMHIKDIFKGFSFSVDAAQAAASSVASSLIHSADTLTLGALSGAQPNSGLSPMQWVKMGIGSIVVVLFAGLGISQKVKWKDLVLSSNVLEGMRKTYTNVSSVGDWFMKEIIGYESEDDYVACRDLDDLVERGSQLQDMPASQFITNSINYYQLRTFVKSIRDATTKPVSQQVSQRYQTVKMLLVQMYKVLSDKLATVHIIMEATQRQATTCFMLSGAPGVGKSLLAEYIFDRCAERLNYNRGSYCLNKRQDGFYGPYGGQAFGIINEFMARRDDDPNLPDLNMIASSDPFNLEGAALECKNQPWHGKLLGLTCNMDNPCLTGVLNEGAALATWDRILCFRVTDPMNEGRNRPNKHRKPDFSHLKFERVYHESLGNCQYEKVDLSAIISQLTGKCAEAEIRHIESVLDRELDEAMRPGLVERKANLINLMKLNSPHDARAAAFTRVNRIGGNGEVITPNAWGRDFFCVRFQGTPGTGKTHLAEYVCRQTSQLFGMPFRLCRDLEEFTTSVTEVPAIYCLDDFFDDLHLNTDLLLQIMNKTHPKSFFLITTNQVVKRKSFPMTFDGVIKAGFAWWQKAQNVQPWDARQYAQTPGLMRRCGLGGEILCGNDIYLNNNEMINHTFTFEEGFKVVDHRTASVTRQNVLERLFDSYRYFINTPINFMLTEGVPPVIDEPAVDIVATNAVKLIKTLKDKMAMMMAYMGRDPEIQMKIDANYYTVSGTSPQTSFDMWYLSPDTPETEEGIKDTFTRLCGIFGKVMPRKALRIYLTEINKSYYFAGGVGYIYGDTTASLVAPIAVDDDKIKYFRSQTDIITIPIPDIIAYKDFKKFVGAYEKLSLTEVMEIDRWVSAYLQSNGVSLYFKHKWITARREAHEAVNDQLNSLKAKIRTHPLFWVGCALVVLCATGGAAYLVSTILFKKNEEKEHDTWCDCEDCLFDRYGSMDPYTSKDGNPNSDEQKEPRVFRVPPKATPNEGTYDTGRQVSKISHKLSTIRRNARHQRAIEEAIKLAPGIPVSVTEKRLDAYYNSNSDNNALLDALLDEKDTPEIRAAIALKTEHVDKDLIADAIKSNMLSKEDMIKQSYPKLKPFWQTLTKHYYKVTSNEGFCYGVGLRGKLILTVSHMFERVDEECSISSDGITYASRCVYIDRDRDLAVVEVIDKEFAPGANTMKYFMPASRKASCPYSFYLKPGPDFEVAGGFSTYHPYSDPPIGDTEKFRFKGEVHVHVWIGLHRVRDALGRGECGFPLVAPDAGSAYRIIGIHNAYNATEKVYFSSFTDEDHEFFCRQALEHITANNASSYMEVVSVDQLAGAPNSEFLTPREYALAFENMLPEVKYGHYADTIEILGFSKELCLRSRPKLKATFLDLPGMMSPVCKIPAAFTMEYVKDTSKLAKSIFGEPDPLITQVCKYKISEEYSWDKTILDHACKLATQYTLNAYGTCKPLRFHEVLNGKDDGSLPPVDPATSAGPYLKMKYGITNKYPLLDVAPNENKRVLVLDKKCEAAQVVKSHYDEFCRSLETGGPPPLLVSKDCAKVELLTKEKAEAGKVRLFNEVDISINWVLKRYFGDFISKVIKGHDTEFIRMGQNPYKTATSIHRQFRAMHGNVVSTDFSGFDKQIPAELIFRFCRLVAEHYLDAFPGLTHDEVRALYEKLAYTLVYAIHTCKGTIILVDRGNESGSMVTTLLNSIAVLILTFYDGVEWFWLVLGFLPLLAEILREMVMAIFGDDRTVKFSSRMKITFENLVATAAKFGLTCTLAKTTGDIDFCSRSFVWDDRWQITWPELKTDSIYAMLRWVKSVEPGQILDNIDNALFEAALHNDSKVWDICYNDAKVIINNLCLDIGKLRFHSRSDVRRRFVHYVREDEEQACITQHAERDSINEIDRVKDVLAYRRAFILERNEKSSHTKKRSQDSSESSNEPDIPLEPPFKRTPGSHLGHISLSDKSCRRSLYAFLKSTKAKIMPKVDENPVSAVLELLAGARITERPRERCRDLRAEGCVCDPGSYQSTTIHECRLQTESGSANGVPPSSPDGLLRNIGRKLTQLEPMFEFVIELLGECWSGVGRSKRAAKTAAYTACYHGISARVSERVKSNGALATRAKEAAAKHGTDFLYRSIKRHLEHARRVSRISGGDVVVLHRQPPDGALSLDSAEVSDQDGQVLCLSWTAQQLPYAAMHAIYCMQPGVNDLGFKVVVPHVEG